MRMIFWIFAALVILSIAGLAYVRLAPSDPARWNVDPLSVSAADGNGWLIRPEGGNAAAGSYGCAPEILLERLDGIVTKTPRTRRLAGSMAEGQITYITRSQVFGFPDYTTIAAIESGAGSTPVLFARQRFGQKDMGVNRARTQEWVTSLATEPACPPSI